MSRALREDVEFASEGVRCRGWWTLPAPRASGTRSPAIVMAHGFSAVKEMALDRFADAFAAAGFASLAFDYRGLGASDGEPRQDLDPPAQIADYRNAISWVRARSDVAPARIGVWGTSYSGAHALMVAAFDRRVRAVVAQVPALDGWENFARMNGGEEMRAALVEALIVERERIHAGGAPQTMPVVAPAGEPAALPGDESWQWFQSYAERAPNWRNEITLRSLERLLEYAPLRWMDRIAPTPLLIAAEHDFIPIDLTRAVFARAGEPKRLVVLPAGHFAPYEPPHFATDAGLAVEWFRTHL
jgi:pimeloyl-ACP methyl ester carboxylesterase